MVGAIWTGFFALLFLAWCAYDLPGPERLNELKRQPSVTLLAADGSLIASYGDLYGDSVRLADLPPYLPAAVIATEDRRFYSHFGVDLIGLARAALRQRQRGGVVQGGSTITQQLAKNLFLTPERSLHRKVQETLLALWLERNFTKDQILALYLNRVYFGAGTYGVEAAARSYFGNSAREVTHLRGRDAGRPAEGAVALQSADDQDRAKARGRAGASRNMVEAGQLTEAEASAIPRSAPRSSRRPAAARPAISPTGWSTRSPAYVGYVDHDLIVARRSIRACSARRNDRCRACSRSKGPARGEPGRAGRDARPTARPGDGRRPRLRESQFNRATQALRQPGSAFKPFVFLAAVEAAMRPATVRRRADPHRQLDARATTRTSTRRGDAARRVRALDQLVGGAVCAAVGRRPRDGHGAATRHHRAAVLDQP